MIPKLQVTEGGEVGEDTFLGRSDWSEYWNENALAAPRAEADESDSSKGVPKLIDFGHEQRVRMSALLKTSA